MADDIFIQSRSPVSHRHAFLEDDGETAYLYLSAPAQTGLERAVPAYTRLPPPDKVDWDKLRQEHAPPRLSIAIASDSAVIAAPDASEFSFLWSTDGESVALLRKGQPLALSTAGEKLGYSKAVKAAGPLAHPWDEARFQALFAH